MSFITIKGGNEIAGRIRNVAQLRGVKSAIARGALHLKNAIAQYPAASEANRPTGYPGHWYERGYGPRWARKGGGAGGRRTSETLGRKWTVAKRNGGLTAVIGNNVSYGPYVQDRGKQAEFHARRGWRTTDDVVEREGEAVVSWVAEKIEKALS
jgi:hypothetical protein